MAVSRIILTLPIGYSIGSLTGFSISAPFGNVRFPVNRLSKRDNIIRDTVTVNCIYTKAFATFVYFLVLMHFSCMGKQLKCVIKYKNLLQPRL